MARPMGGEDKGYIIDHLTEAQQGALLHAGRPAISEALHQLQKDGLIALERRRINHIYIPNLDLLHAALRASGPRQIKRRKPEQARTIGERA